MKIETYKAFDTNGVLRYVGIGRPGRHEHVNSGKSHSDVINACVAIAGPFNVIVDYVEHPHEDIAWEFAKKWEQDIIALNGRLHLSTGTLLNRSSGGEESRWCADRKWFTSPDGKSKRFKRAEDVPAGWRPGRNLNDLKNCGWGSNRKPPVRSGWVSWFNPETGQIKQLDVGIEPPVGFIRGTGKSTVGGTKWYHNPLTGEVKRFKPENAPKEFKEGRK